MKRLGALLLGLSLFGSSGALLAQQVLLEGYLCCTLRFYPRGLDWREADDGNWVEYRDSFLPGSRVNAKHAYVIRNAAAEPVRARYTFTLIADGKEVTFQNKFHRTLSDAEFLARYISPVDPSARIASFPPEIQAAIRAGRVSKGMTKEQVQISMGKPPLHENPDLGSNVWRYYWGSFDEIAISFDQNDRVHTVSALPFALKDVLFQP